MKCDNKTMRYALLTGERHTMTDQFGRKLHRVIALKDGKYHESGDIGGWVENYDCLEQDSHAWVFDSSKVFGNARLEGDSIARYGAIVTGDIRPDGRYWRVVHNPVGVWPIIIEGERPVSMKIKKLILDYDVLFIGLGIVALSFIIGSLFSSLCK